MTDDKKDNKIEEQLEKKFSRRNFIQGTGLTVGGLIVGGGIGSLLGYGTKNEEPPKKVETSQPIPEEPKEIPNHTEAMLFFTRKEDFDTLVAATEVIFPEDEHGPGAIGLGAPYYIDKQLAGAWGRNADDYRVRPYKNGELLMTRGEVMILGLRKINEVSQERNQDIFISLNEEEQIAILQDFEEDNIKMNLVSSAAFFSLLRQLTIEGCYSDPLYGGNKNMEGWKMKEFPGAHMSHTDVVESEEFVAKEPISLSEHM